MDLGASYQQICIGALYRYYFKRYGLWPRYWRGIPRFIEGFRYGEPQPSRFERIATSLDFDRPSSLFKAFSTDVLRRL